MDIQSTRFGEITIPEDFLLHFPEGLPGFAEEKDFAFLTTDPEGSFAYLQSTNNQDLTFILVDPFSFFKHYSFEMDEAMMELLGVTEEDPPQVFSIVKVPEKVEELSANLVAPIVINWKKHVGTQVVLNNSPYSVNQRLFPYGLPKLPK